MRQGLERRKNISLKRALYWILISTCLVSGTTALVTLYFFHVQEIRLHDTRFTIQRIAQKGASLSSDYLAEVLELSADAATNLSAYSTGLAQKKLLASPVIRRARVEKLMPDTLMIDYRLRKPRLRLIDFDNAAVDDAGVLFPLEPFFQEGPLPELYLGRLKKNISWGDAIDADRRRTAFEILHESLALDLPFGLQITRIDLSKIENPSLGVREIVLKFAKKDTRNEWILRCKVDDVNVQLSRFARLISLLKEANGASRDENGSTIIDFRVPQLAFILNPF